MTTSGRKLFTAYQHKKQTAQHTWQAPTHASEHVDLYPFTPQTLWVLHVSYLFNVACVDPAVVGGDT